MAAPLHADPSICTVGGAVPGPGAAEQMGRPVLWWAGTVETPPTAGGARRSFNNCFVLFA